MVEYEDLYISCQLSYGYYASNLVVIGEGAVNDQTLV